ncbi:MAG: DUF2784 domain-containing protein [Acidobacteria bacterium]|nr:DUF2784 domain-containing protein [Acidobacteriota bacterium]
MSYGILADAVLVAHVAFVGFVVLGGLLVRFRPCAIWLHLPAVVWGVGIEWSGAICPLTPLEQWLRARAGVGGYEGTFIEHYLWPLLYPAALTRSDQMVLGALALAINAAAYGWLWLRVRSRRRPTGGPYAGGRDR